MKALFAHKWLSILFGLILFSADVFPQRVGLVLSGGGAKGLTHIGIIRALEENNIPIDYITGTSMGAIVGSLYAMGYSPDEMEQLIRSDDFKRWYSGQIEDKYVFYLRNHEPTPDFFNINLSFKDSASVKTQFIPTSVVNPIQMNIAFMKLYAEATAQCKGDFDELFIPFRCVASDVYHKRELVLGNGDLGNAVRASMTFPFMFKPIELDSVLVYDGGIYNNFPADVMMETFKPDVIIGSVVASNPARPDENDMIGQVENMIMQKTDYSLPDSVGILMTFKYNDINLMDFDKIDRLVKIGYDRTMSLMDSIKMKVDRRMSEDVLNLRRDMYKSRLPELRFKKIYIEGVNAQQSRYIRNEISKNEDETFSYDDFVRSYFRLLSGSSISEIIPQAVYNPDEGVYDLRLKVKVEAPLSVKIGGSVSSSTSNQIYFGVSYRDLNYYSKEIIFDGQLGKVYNNLQLSGRLDLTTKLPISIKFIAGLSSFDYFRKDKLFSLKDSPSFTKKEERFAKVKVALPFLSNKKAEVGVGVAQHVNQYYQSNIVDMDKKEMDKSEYYLMYAQKVYDFQKSHLQTGDGVYYDMLGGPSGMNDTNIDKMDDASKAKVYETVDGVKYKGYLKPGGPTGNPLSYNSGTMLSGAADLFRVTDNQQYLLDMSALVDATFKYFAKLGTVVPELYTYAYDGFNNWFNGVMLRGWVDVFPFYNNAALPIESFQNNLDYAYENSIEEGTLPTSLLHGWSSNRNSCSVKGFFQFAYAAQYAALARYELEN